MSVVITGESICCRYGGTGLEKYLIDHCAPTLASLKTASLFSFPCTDGERLAKSLRQWNAAFDGKGIQLSVLRQKPDTALIYVYRKKKLQTTLENYDIARFLQRYGYPNGDMAGALRHLTKRLKNQNAFPHEIGVFLGYPLEDVVGFIRNAGRNSKCSGCWKVYCNECEAKLQFARFKECERLYRRLWDEGNSVLQLTV